MTKQKHICILCYEKRGRKANSFATDWKSRLVMCVNEPLRKDEFGGWSMSEIFSSINSPPPDTCPYQLEHAMIQ